MVRPYWIWVPTVCQCTVAPAQIWHTQPTAFSNPPPRPRLPYYLAVLTALVSGLEKVSPVFVALITLLIHKHNLVSQVHILLPPDAGTNDRLT